MIRAHQLTKRFGDRAAVDGIDFVVEPGRVTGFLGPNGAGKSTTMRMTLGLDRPTSGTVSVNGHRYAASPAPLREIGALLEAHAIHPGRSARDHLRWMAASNGIPTTRVGEVLEMVGLDTVAGQRAGRFSLGMGQRLGIAAALIGDPHTVILDEPVNGLDPEGVVWVRHLAKYLASEGRTVFLSSHLMSEMAQTADHLVVIGRGRILADAPIQQILAGGRTRTRLRATDREAMRRALQGTDAGITEFDDDGLLVTGPEPRRIAEAALSHGVLVHELTPLTETLEDVYMAMTQNEVEYRSGGAPAPTDPAPWAGADARTGDRA